jgi:perosamine synthetase
VTTDDESLATKIRKIGGLGFKTLTAGAGRVRTDRDKLQSPDWERFDAIGYNYRLNQLAAAIALAQVERQDYFIGLRKLAGMKYTATIRESKLLTAQKVIEGSVNTFYTFSAKFDTDNSRVSWADFRKKYMSLGGDGIYAASKLMYQEPIFRELSIGKERTPIAEKIQTQIMNFTTNQSNEEEIDHQCEILMKTLEVFGE